MPDEFEPKKLSFVVHSVEEGEDFLRGLIVARSNNSSPIFPKLIDGVNNLLQPYRASALQADMDARRRAGMS
jgi:hypothetical protein